MFRIPLPLIVALSIFLMGEFFAASVATAQTPPGMKLEKESIPSLISSTRFLTPLNFCGESVPMNDPFVREGVELEVLFRVWNRPQTLLWLKRAPRYFPKIEALLKKAGMPDDLKYLTVIESSLNPNAGSPKGAAGIWQFMPATGKHYGLKVGSVLDERYDFSAATTAAIKHLKELKEEFGSWTLAAAAYNLGGRRLRENITFQETDNYYHLRLPQETQRYVLKALAVKQVLESPEKYGFFLTASDLYAPFDLARVNVNVPAATHMKAVAKAAGVYYKTIRDINPQIRAAILSKGVYPLYIPRASAKTFAHAFEKWRTKVAAKQSKKSKKAKKTKTYVVRTGDSLGRIAQRLGVTSGMLRKWNNLKSNSVIHPGDKLKYVK